MVLQKKGGGVEEAADKKSVGRSNSSNNKCNDQTQLHSVNGVQRGPTHTNEVGSVVANALILGILHNGVAYR
jgi:hypothetical protein